MTYQPQAAKSAIFGNTGGKKINLAGTFLYPGGKCCFRDVILKVERDVSNGI